MPLGRYSLCIPGMPFRNLADLSTLLYCGGLYCSPRSTGRASLPKVKNGEKSEPGTNSIDHSLFHVLRYRKCLSNLLLRRPELRWRWQ
jgi:hypothetical protein